MFILFCIIHEVFPVAETDLKAEIQTLRNRDEELKQRIQEVRFVYRSMIRNCPRRSGLSQRSRGTLGTAPGGQLCHRGQVAFGTSLVGQLSFATEAGALEPFRCQLCPLSYWPGSLRTSPVGQRCYRDGG
jgi:hypothetical protein